MLIETWRLLQDRHDFFLRLLWEHLQISLCAIMLATVIGLFIGIMIVEWRGCARIATAMVNFTYTIPSIAMFGFLIPFSGIGDTTAVIALTIYALLPMVRNTHAGLASVDPLLVEAATGMGSTRFQTLIKIKLPLAMPVILAGIRNLTVMTIALAGIASFVGAGGLGVAIYRGITTNNRAMTLAGSLLIALLAILADYAIGILERRAKPWAKEE